MRSSFLLVAAAAALALAFAATAAGRPDAAAPAVSGGYKIVAATAVSSLTWEGYKGSDDTVWSGFEKGAFTLVKPRQERAQAGHLLLTVRLKGKVSASYSYVNPTSSRTCPQTYDATQLGVNVGLTVMPVGANKMRIGGGPDISVAKANGYGRLGRVCDSQFIATLWQFSDYGTNGYGWDDKTYPSSLFRRNRFQLVLQGSRTIRDSLWSLDPGRATRRWKLVITLQRTP